MNGIRPAVGADVETVEGLVRAAYQPWAEQIGMRPFLLDADYWALVADGQVHVTEPDIDGVLVLSAESGALVGRRPSAHGEGAQ